jgi:hypothetical protein
MFYLPLQCGQMSISYLPSPPDPADANSSSPRVAIQVADHERWARLIARGVRRTFHFKMGSQEEQDLEQTAYLAIVELIERFDPAKIPIGGNPDEAFRGWAAIEVRSRCQREARRLRNGGTYCTRREKNRKPITVERLKNGLELVDPRSVVKEEESEDEVDT